MIPALGCGQGMWSVLDVVWSRATAPPDKCRPSLSHPLPSWAVHSCSAAVSPVGSSIPEEFLCLGKGKAGNAGAGLSSLLSPSPIPAFPCTAPLGERFPSVPERAGIWCLGCVSPWD